jgi:hypothetical protein
VKILLTLAGLAFIAFAFIATEEAWGLLMSGIMAIATISVVVDEIQKKREKAIWAKRSQK